MLLSELLEEFAFHCECRRFSDKTIFNYKKQIQYLLDYLEDSFEITELEEVEPKQIRSFLMGKMKEGRKPSYINDLLKAFKVYFKYAYEEGYSPTLITQKIQNVKEPKVIIRTFSKKEIKKMLECFTGNDFINIRNKTILVLFFDTGIRLSELTQLRDEQLHDNHILIFGKGEKQRVVPKTPIVSKWLQKYIRTRNAFFDSDSFTNLFVSRYKDGISPSMVNKIVKDAGRYAMVKEDIRVSPHTLRHTFCQQQLKNGLDIYSLSRIMGHESISITQRYLQGIRDNDILISAKTTSTIMNL